jgi:lipid II:glycine glycyltransferase (peptidoglycan interpeptide bridge formation enzyme)
VTVTAAEEFRLWERYHRIYCESINRWKKKKNHTGVSYDINFFKEIYQVDSKYRKLWLAIVDNEPVAGIICFYWNRHAVVWLGAGLESFFDYHPNDLVYHNAIKDAAEKGFHWFDCNPSAGLDGVYNFKRSLGAEVLQTNYINRKSTLRGLAERLRVTLQNARKDSTHA